MKFNSGREKFEMKHQLLVDFIERGLVLGSGDIAAVARHAHKAVRDTDGLHDDSVHEEARHSSQIKKMGRQSMRC